MLEKDLIHNFVDYYKNLKIHRTITRKTLSYQSMINYIKSNLNKIVLNYEFGYSFIGRSIPLLKIGNGNIKVLLWSQMHGNEPSSTIALLSVLEYLQHSKTYFSKVITKKLKLLAIPMLNPDGAELGIRRNAMNIDINRDAIKSVTPEATLLKKALTKYNPEWAFNLHDQDIYYGTASASIPTSLAVLVPAANKNNTLTQNRLEAINALGFAISALQEFGPEKFDKLNIAKYNAQYIPNAFGDYFSSFGIKTILLETGYFINDKDRAKATMLHATALILTLFYIAYVDENIYIDYYNNLDINVKDMFYDYIFRNIMVEINDGRKFTIDVALRRYRANNEEFTDYVEEYVVEDVGDLQFKLAFVDVDCSKCSAIDLHHLRLLKKKSPAKWLLKLI